MKDGEALSVVDVQHQIRANASQLQDYFSDLYAWEQSIGKEDAVRKRAARTAKTSATAGATPPPPRRTARVVGVGGDNGEEVGAVDGKKPDAHTYDKGYERWEKFDVDAALREADEDGSVKTTTEDASPSPSLQGSPAPRRVVGTGTAASSPATTKSREELEKEEGNAHYKRGDYVAAIKSYTRCLGYNPQNAVVLSNRAMAYLKNREFANAEDDCTLALKADPSHVKSYSRRGTARNSLGKHRLALLDFQQAADLDPKSRQIQTQLQSTRELIRTAIKRAPKRTEFEIEVVGESPPSKQPGSARESDDSEDKENICTRQQVKLPSATATTKQKSPLQETDPAQLPSAPPSTTTTTTPAQPEAKPKKMSSVILPKLPKKAPATSYEFGRVWKTLTLRGDSDQRSRLINLRADYLRMIDPSAVRTIFKTAIESDILCEIFHVFRHGVLSASNSETSSSFVLAFASELTKVTRFNMTIMLLSDKEKENMAWVISRLEEWAIGGDESQAADLKKRYELS
ncbi:RNA polymerase II-associated protein 3 [Phytophthora cinnamomi]|uniref:RNA polymerase II-associated protein 3 n=1 Tax=Phytophthora cinnamomi TaxID=4785 RepID=UPI003559CE84|nr:RNA polymerase II-associated protein 3 [Phytophthora cinnamomi]